MVLAAQLSRMVEGLLGSLLSMLWPFCVRLCEGHDPGHIVL